MEVEIKSYVTLILCYIFLGLYFVWSLLPAGIIHSYGMTYYPSKHWAVVLPSSVCFLVVCVAFHNWFKERSMLPELDSHASYTDSYGRKSYNIQAKQKLCIYDVPLEAVNSRMYS